MNILPSRTNHGYNRVLSHVDPTLMLNTGKADPHADADLELAHRIMNCLKFHYPGHPWRVEVSHHRNVGCAYIMLPGFTSCRWVLHISELKNDPGMKAVVHAGGEFLERYRMPRCGIDFDAYLTAMQNYGGIFRRKLAPPE